MARNRESKSVPKVKLTRAEKKQLAAIMAQAQKKKGPQTAQQTIPYQRMWPDGTVHQSIQQGLRRMEKILKNI